MKKILGVLFFVSSIYLTFAPNMPAGTHPLAIVLVAILANGSLVAGSPIFDKVSLGLGAFILAGAISQVVTGVVFHAIIAAVQIAWLIYWLRKVLKDKKPENPTYAYALLATADVILVLSLIAKI